MSSNAPRASQRVGPFELIDRLGGSMGTSVYRAVRPAGSRDPREVRIRIADDPADERAAAWIRHEYDVLRALDDPRVPAVHGYYASQVAVALGHTEAITLREALDVRAEGRVPIDVATSLDLLVELVQALRHAHGSNVIEGGVVHSALRPELIEVDRDGRIRIYGFGADPGPAIRGYAAPELEAAAFVDPRTDQWALGALAIELVLGQRLYAGIPNADAEARAGRVGAWVDRLERRFPSLARVVGRLLAPAAGDRYADEGELLRELLEVSRTLGGRADRTGLVARVIAARPMPEPELEPEPEPENKPTVAADPAPTGPPALPPSATLVPEPADAPSVTPTSSDAVPDPAAVPPASASPAVVASEVTVEPDSTSFFGSSPEQDGTVSGPAATAPTPAAGSTSVPEEEEITEVVSPRQDPTEPALGQVDPIADDAEVPRSGGEPLPWSPLELLALSLAGLLAVIGLVFMVWRFG